MTSIRVAYVPEHFSTPLFFAERKEIYSSKGLLVNFVPVPEGTGRLIKLLDENEIDIAIGLTEGFIADVSKGNTSYKLVSTYVKSPLCWAVSSGYNRSDINTLQDLAGKKIGVSRIGSGSYVMSFVLGHQLQLQEPFFSGYPVCSNFKNLRDSVNHSIDDEDKYSDAFMWEHFTSKKYFDNHEIKKIGEIYTPWPSWVITARSGFLQTNRESVKAFLESLSLGIDYFNHHQDEAVSYIASNLDYSEEDAREWLKTVKFNPDLVKTPFDWSTVVENTSSLLQTAGVLTDANETIQQRLENGILKLI